MTLILSKVGGFGGITQVSDRLAVYQGGDTFCRHWNKSLIYRAPDAFVVMSYTGAAFIDGIPTDQWLANVIRDEDYPDEGPGRWTTSGRLKRWQPLYPALRHIRDALRVSLRKQQLEIAIAGWERVPNRRFALPCHFTLGNGKADREFTIERQPKRHFFWHVRRGASGGPTFAAYLRGQTIEQMRRLPPVVLSSTPPANSTPNIGMELLNRIGLAATEVVERSMVEAIREAADARPAVGKDCMVITLASPSDASVRFEPHTHQHAKRRTSRGEISVAYSPWIIGPGLSAAPSVMSAGGSLRFTIGAGTVVTFSSVPDPDEGPRKGLLFFQSSHQRPKLPRKKS